MSADGDAAMAPLNAKVALLLADCSKDGWDSYGAGALTVEAVAAIAKNLADHLYPSVNGGLMLEWDFTDHGPAGRSSLIVEFAEDGSLIDFYATDGSREVEWEATPAPAASTYEEGPNGR